MQDDALEGEDNALAQAESDQATTDALAEDGAATAAAENPDAVFEDLPDTLIAPAEGPTPTLTPHGFSYSYQTGDPALYAYETPFAGMVLADGLTGGSGGIAGSASGPWTEPYFGAPNFMPDDLGVPGFAYDWQGYGQQIPFGLLGTFTVSSGSADFQGATSIVEGDGVGIGDGFIGIPELDLVRTDHRTAGHPSLPISAISDTRVHFGVDASLLNVANTPSAIGVGGYSQSQIPTSPHALLLASTGTTSEETQTSDNTSLGANQPAAQTAASSSSAPSENMQDNSTMGSEQASGGDPKEPPALNDRAGARAGGGGDANGTPPAENKANAEAVQEPDKKAKKTGTLTVENAGRATELSKKDHGQRFFFGIKGRDLGKAPNGTQSDGRVAFNDFNNKLPKSVSDTKLQEFRDKNQNGPVGKLDKDQRDAVAAMRSATERKIFEWNAVLGTPPTSSSRNPFESEDPYVIEMLKGIAKDLGSQTSVPDLQAKFQQDGDFFQGYTVRVILVGYSYGAAAAVYEADALFDAMTYLKIDPEIYLVTIDGIDPMTQSQKDALTHGPQRAKLMAHVNVYQQNGTGFTAEIRLPNGTVLKSPELKGAPIQGATLNAKINSDHVSMDEDVLVNGVVLTGGQSLAQIVAAWAAKDLKPASP